MGSLRDIVEGIKNYLSVTINPNATCETCYVDSDRCGVYDGRKGLGQARLCNGYVKELGRRNLI